MENMIRKMSPLEEKTAHLLVEAGENAHWEYSASLQCPQGPLLEFRTEKLDNQANPSTSVLDKMSQWPNFVLHHNHLSGQSLSFADWRGVSMFFNEIYAHCNDGTVYYGRVLDKVKVLHIIDNLKDDIEVKSENILFKYTNNNELASFFRKEVICRYLKIKGYVEYGYFWGNLSISHQKVLNLNIQNIVSIGGLGNAYEDLVQCAALNLSDTYP